MENNILEGNNLIADFMGLEKQDTFGGKRYVYEVFGNKYTLTLHFHESWDWLIPVAKKILKTCDEKVKSFSYEERILDKGSDKSLSDPTAWRCWSYKASSIITFNWEINRLWNACVEFIKWYQSLNPDLR